MRLTLVAAAIAVASATTYLKETFDEDFKKHGWTVGSEWKAASEMGEWKWTSGKLGADAGIQTGPDARHHSISKQLDTPFDNKGKDLILSYTVRFDEQEIDCGGAYIKLLPGGFDAKKFGGDTPYAIMFGPDQCGYSTKKTHVIFTGADGKNHQTKKSVRMETDRNSHRYTLIVRPDNTYEVLIDGTRAEGGKIEADFDLLPPAEIPDESAVKPSDWVDEEFIFDESGKPEGFDDWPEEVPNKDTKPADWDDEEDGEWVPTTKKKSEIWSPKKLPNPAYKGTWVRPNKPNPARKAGDTDDLHHLCHSCKAVGFELWQVKSGVIFDDIIVTDSLAEAEAFAKSTFETKKAAEKAKLEAEEEKKKAEAAKAAEEAKKASAEADKSKAASTDDEDEDKDEL